jgi:hypothetical protein
MFAPVGGGFFFIRKIIHDLKTSILGKNRGERGSGGAGGREGREDIVREAPLRAESLFLSVVPTITPLCALGEMNYDSEKARTLQNFGEKQVQVPWVRSNRGKAHMLLPPVLFPLHISLGRETVTYTFPEFVCTVACLGQK